MDKVLLNRNDFLVLLKSCLPGTDMTKTALQGADTFIFHDGRVLAYNDWIGVSADCGFDLSFNVDASVLVKFITSIKTKELKMWLDSNNLCVSAGASQMELPVRVNKNARRYASVIPENPDWRVLPSDFFSGLKTVQVPGNGKFSGVFCSGNVMVSSEDNSISLQDIDGNLEKMWFSNKVANTLSGFPGATHYCVYQAWVHFKYTDGRLFSCHRLNTESYPIASVNGFTSMWLSAPSTASGVFSKELESCLKEAKLVSGLGEDGQSIVWLSIDDGALGISSESRKGKYSSDVVGEYVGSDITLGVDVERIQQLLKQGAARFEIRTTEKGSVLFAPYSKGFMFVGTVKKEVKR